MDTIQQSSANAEMTRAACATGANTTTAPTEVPSRELHDGSTDAQQRAAPQLRLPDAPHRPASSVIDVPPLAHDVPTIGNAGASSAACATHDSNVAEVPSHQVRNCPIEDVGTPQSSDVERCGKRVRRSPRHVVLLSATAAASAPLSPPSADVAVKPTTASAALPVPSDEEDADEDNEEAAAGNVDSGMPVLDAITAPIKRLYPLANYRIAAAPGTDEEDVVFEHAVRIEVTLRSGDGMCVTYDAVEEYSAEGTVIVMIGCGGDARHEFANSGTRYDYSAALFGHVKRAATVVRRFGERRSKLVFFSTSSMITHCSLDFAMREHSRKYRVSLDTMRAAVPPIGEPKTVNVRGGIAVTRYPKALSGLSDEQLLLELVAMVPKELADKYAAELATPLAGKDAKERSKRLHSDLSKEHQRPKIQGHRFAWRKYSGNTRELRYIIDAIHERAGIVLGVFVQRFMAAAAESHVQQFKFKQPKEKDPAAPKRKRQVSKHRELDLDDSSEAESSGGSGRDGGGGAAALATLARAAVIDESPSPPSGAKKQKRLRKKRATAEPEASSTSVTTVATVSKRTLQKRKRKAEMEAEAAASAEAEEEEDEDGDDNNDLPEQLYDEPSDAFVTLDEPDKQRVEVALAKKRKRTSVNRSDTSSSSTLSSAPATASTTTTTTTTVTAGTRSKRSSSSSSTGKAKTAVHVLGLSDVNQMLRIQLGGAGGGIGSIPHVEVSVELSLVSRERLRFLADDHSRAATFLAGQQRLERFIKHGFTPLTDSVVTITAAALSYEVWTKVLVAKADNDKTYLRTFGVGLAKGIEQLLVEGDIPKKFGWSAAIASDDVRRYDPTAPGLRLSGQRFQPVDGSAEFVEWGVQALREFAPHHILAQYNGTLIPGGTVQLDGEECAYRLAGHAATHAQDAYAALIEHLCVSARGTEWHHRSVAARINHSPDAKRINCYWCRDGDRIVIKSLRFIPAGSMLFIDYGTSYVDEWEAMGHRIAQPGESIDSLLDAQRCASVVHPDICDTLAGQAPAHDFSAPLSFDSFAAPVDAQKQLARGDAATLSRESSSSSDSHHHQHLEFTQFGISAYDDDNDDLGSLGTSDEHPDSLLSEIYNSISTNLLGGRNGAQHIDILSQKLYERNTSTPPPSPRRGDKTVGVVFSEEFQTYQVLDGGYAAPMSPSRGMFTV